MRQPTNGHQRHYNSPMAAVEKKPVNNVELQHQAEKPVWSGPNHLVGRRHEVVDHEQLGDDMRCSVVVGAGRNGINHRESNEAHNHHLEELEEVNAYKRHASRVRCVVRTALVFAIKAIGTEEKEHRHTVMAEEREQMHGQKTVCMSNGAVQSVDVIGEKLIFVLAHYAPKPMAIVVHEDSNYGESAHCVALRTAQQPASFRVISHSLPPSICRNQPFPLSLSDASRHTAATEYYTPRDSLSSLFRPDKVVDAAVRRSSCACL